MLTDTCRPAWTTTSTLWNVITRPGRGAAVSSRMTPIMLSGPMLVACARHLLPRSPCTAREQSRCSVVPGSVAALSLCEPLPEQAMAVSITARFVAIDRVLPAYRTDDRPPRYH